MERSHHYQVAVNWTGNSGTGTSGYRDYKRTHEISSPRKAAILGSSDPTFRGDGDRWNPEELLVASLAACHQLWYLHLCSESGIVVTGYSDAASGVMEEGPEGNGRFTVVTLRPHAALSNKCDAEKAHSLHEAAHRKCFIANSVNFPLVVEPSFEYPK